MPAWIPIIKSVLPYVAPVVQAAVPVFTKRKEESGSVAPDPITAQQIEELQAAVNANNEFVKAIATALEESAKANDAALKRMRVMTAVSTLLSLAALVIAVSVRI